ncbi:putative metabolite transport protein CsbC [Planctomycetes bacterium MalM25]|nr:putative metabolite transport protein CsbC [Planctomycetes bacterium MalM25]
MRNHERNALLYATIVSLGGFLFGLDAALIAGTTDMITEEFSLTAMQLGTVVSAPALGVLIALPFAGYACNRFGRKATLLLISVLYLVSAVCSAIAPSYATLVAARFLGGLAFSSISVASMYIGEIAPPSWRGTLVSMTQINIVLGLSGAYFINYLIHHGCDSEAAWVTSLGVNDSPWRWMLGSEVPFALVWLGLLAMIPESPSWLVMRGRGEEAGRVLSRVLPEGEAPAHLAEMQAGLRANASSHSPLTQLAELFGPATRRTVLIATTIAIAQQSTGINAILFYAQTVFQQLGVGQDAAFSQAIWVGLTSVVFTVLGLLLVDRLGRRPLIIWGMLWIVASLGLCAYLFSEARYTLTSGEIASLEDAAVAGKLAPLAGEKFASDLDFKRALTEALGREVAQRQQSLLLQKAARLNAGMLLFGILSFIGAFHFSVGPVMWVLFSEIFPTSTRAIAIPFFTVVTSLTNYVVQQFFPWQLENMGMSSIFLGYAAVVSLGLVILFFTLPETKNLTIEEVQAKLSSDKNAPAPS